jgi:hypothetical protein
MSQNAPVSETLQASTVISKTAQTLIGKVIATGGYEFLTLFFTYIKGDETGLTLIPSTLQSATGTTHPFAEWSAAAGAKTVTSSNFALTASRNGYITLDVRGIAYIMFTQGGTANDGTPTGTLAASYSLK